MSNHEEGRCRGKRWSEWSIRARVGVIVAAMILVPGFLALFSAITMWLWNWLMPTIFNLPTIGFWQAVGILILAQILFKGGHVRRAGRSSWKKARIRAQMKEEGAEGATE